MEAQYNKTQAYISNNKGQLNSLFFFFFFKSDHETVKMCTFVKLM